MSTSINSLMNQSALPPAYTVVRAMYDAINRRDVATAIAYIDPNCTYQDLNFSQPFQGRAAITGLFTESCEGIPDDLLFVIDDITTGDSLSVGILWHVELDGIPFPNGRGASFYRISETTGQIVFARDLVEPPFKPGHVSFSLIRLVTPLVRRLKIKNKKQVTTESSLSFDQEENQPIQYLDSNTQRFPVSIVLWAIAIVYTYILLLSPTGQFLPGEPIWAIQPDTVQEVLNESINFFLILPVLNALGLTYRQAPISHPTTDALFNVAIVWVFMFLPLLLLDSRGRHLPKVALWSTAMFLTNVFLTPYMALRARYPVEPVMASPQKGALARTFGAVGLIVGTGAIAWGLFARPEFGSWIERWHYFLGELTTSRVAIAFCADLVLFSVWQIILMGAIEPIGSPKRWLRFIPLWGLAVWLIL